MSSPEPEYQEGPALLTDDWRLYREIGEDEECLLFLLWRTIHGQLLRVVEVKRQIAFAERRRPRMVRLREAMHEELVRVYNRLHYRPPGMPPLVSYGSDGTHWQCDSCGDQVANVVICSGCRPGHVRSCLSLLDWTVLRYSGHFPPLQSVRYCDGYCQSSHWLLHKQVCLGVNTDAGRSRLRARCAAVPGVDYHLLQRLLDQVQARRPDRIACDWSLLVGAPCCCQHCQLIGDHAWDQDPP